MDINQLIFVKKRLVTYRMSLIYLRIYNNRYDEYKKYISKWYEQNTKNNVF